MFSRVEILNEKPIVFVPVTIYAAYWIFLDLETDHRKLQCKWVWNWRTALKFKRGQTIGVMADFIDHLLNTDNSFKARK